MIRNILKYLFLLIILGLAGLVAYTYVAPVLGVDFAPPQAEIREPVTLHVD